MQVVETLASKLKVGGVWYYTGEHVQLDEQDALALRVRGLSSPAPKGAKPKNVIPAADVGIVTKDESVADTTAREVRSHGRRTR